MNLKEAREKAEVLRSIDEKTYIDWAEHAVVILDDRVAELEGLLKEIYPQIYGMLCETWGHPKDWPKYGAAGAITYEKIKVALGIDSDKEVSNEEEPHDPKRSI